MERHRNHETLYLGIRNEQEQHIPFCIKNICKYLKCKRLLANQDCGSAFLLQKIGQGHDADAFKGSD